MSILKTVEKGARGFSFNGNVYSDRERAVRAAGGDDSKVTLLLMTAAGQWIQVGRLVRR